ncbi:MAG: HAD family phosphatase [Candidatus Rokubacteria bacterium]|nr:HAD family phosphatase [Candidatus Rokubacteria bacterium]
MTAPAPRAVLLDFGGVIWDMRWDVARGLEAEYGLPGGSVFATLYGSDMWREVERGRAEPAAWRAAAHQALEEAAGRPLPPLHDVWRAAQGPIGENIELLRALRPAYRLAIVSNADTTLRTRLRDGLDIADLFDEIVCSAEVGVIKPEPEIWALACRRLDLPPAACVFVDDHEPNVRAAEALGLRAILYRVDRGDDLRAQLAAAGVVPRRS